MSIEKCMSASITPSLTTTDGPAAPREQQLVCDLARCQHSKNAFFLFRGAGIYNCQKRGHRRVKQSSRWTKEGSSIWTIEH